MNGTDGRTPRRGGALGRSRLARFLAYGICGATADAAYAAVHDGARGRRHRFSLGEQIWMVPIYGLLQPIFEPVHEAVRTLPPPVRAAVYGAGFLATEYATGWLLRRLRGRAPWDYGEARLNLHGLIRADYFPLWGAVGLACERAHDFLTESPTGTKEPSGR